MYLVITEKPSVARSIADVIGVQKREDGYLEGKDCIVSWCLGHLAEYVSPDAYDEKFSRWNYEDLPIIDMDILTDYEKAKENLFIRVFDADRNQEMLSKVPHTRVENLAITYHIFANSGADGIASAIVNNEMMKLFGVSKDQLHQDALENSPKVFPVKIESMDKMMENMMRNDMRAAGVKEEDIDQMMEEMYQNMAVPLTIVMIWSIFFVTPTLKK